MRGRLVLVLVLAVVIALVGVYVGLSTNTPKAVGEPSTATPSDSSVGPVQPRPSGSGSLRSPAASSQQAGRQTGSPKPAGNPGGNATPPGHKPAKQPPPQAPPQPQPSLGPVRFGKVTTTPSDDSVDTSVAPSDHRALTTTFSDREAQVGNQGDPPDASRSFSMTLPLTDGARGETLRVYVQGYALVAEGASARLTLKLNGRVKVRDYPSGWDDEVFETLELPAVPATTYQLSGVVEVHQDPGTDGGAYLNVLSVDASFS